MTAVRRVVDQIHPEVFEQFPGYCWGKVICWDVDNRRGLEEATLLLRDVEARMRQDESLADVVSFGVAGCRGLLLLGLLRIQRRVRRLLRGQQTLALQHGLANLLRQVLVVE